MIDYEKLRIAHELAEEWKKQTNTPATICICHMLNNRYRYVLTDGKLHQEAFDDIGDLIAKLTELAQPPSKYKVGDEVWLLVSSDDRIYSYIIEKMFFDGEYWYCEDTTWCIREKELYPSKESLIEAQIKYWESLKIEAISNSKTCPKCGMQRLMGGVCWNSHCDSQFNPPFQGEVKGFSSCCSVHTGANEECHQSQSECQHEYQKTLSTSGMYFINMCHKCGDQKPWVECQHESDGTHHHMQSKSNPNEFIAPIWKCLKCGEFYR